MKRYMKFTNILISIKMCRVSQVIEDVINIKMALGEINRLTRYTIYNHLSYWQWIIINLVNLKVT